MTFSRKAFFTAGTRAALGTLLTALSGTGVVWAEPVRRRAQLDVASVGAVAGARPGPSAAEQELRPAAVVREHLTAQRIIDRVCTGC